MNGKNSKRKSIDGFIPSRASGFSQGRNDTGNIGSKRAVDARTTRMIDDFRSRKEGLNTSGIRNDPIQIPAKQASNVFNKNRFGAPITNEPKPNPITSKLDKFQKKRRRSRRKRVILSVLAIVVLFFGFLGAKGYLNLLKSFTGGGGAAALDQDVDPSQLNVEGDGRINILLLGRGGLGHEGPDLTDTIIVVSINPINKTAGMVSVPRDLYVNLQNYGSMKINSVFYTGKQQALSKFSEINKKSIKQAEDQGLKLTEQTVENVLGIPIHYNAIVDFNGFKKAINTVGGVDINVPKAVKEQMRIDGKPYMLDVKKGMHHFSGFEALAYSRSRHTSARGDFDRAERQRLMVLALKEKVLSAGTFSNPTKIAKLMDQFGSSVHTNFSINDIKKLYPIVKDIDDNKVKSIGLADPPHMFLTTGMIGGLSVVLPIAGQDNYEDIHYYIRNALRDSFLEKEDAGVVILNGTGTPGLGLTKAEELRSYGYRVTRVDNAPSTNYASTQLIDMNHRDNKYTRHYLEKRLNLTSNTNLPDGSIKVGTNDFVIILGDDAAQ